MPRIPTLWIAVPTYWTYPLGERGPVQTVFDHPTPLDQDGTLARTLASFRRLEGDFNVLVVVGTSHHSLGEAAHRKVAEIVRPFAGDFALYLVSSANLSRFAGGLENRILSLDTYGNIRNVQLALPFTAGCEVVVGIDDDEIIEDPGFLFKVRRFIGKEHRGQFVGGMAGPYLDKNGEFRLAGAEELASEPNIFIKKNYFMNQALVKVMRDAPEDGIVKSNVAFGGNMCMHRSTIALACHDPYIPRGEDYDYVINAKMRGVDFFFQPSMCIVHLPPDSTGSQAGDNVNKLVADIRRFIYMREKLAYHREHFPQEVFDYDPLMPYPGVYLSAELDLAAEGIAALDRLYPEFRLRCSPEDLVKRAVSTARIKAREFFEYRRKWYALTRELDGKASAAEAVASYRM